MIDADRYSRQRRFAAIGDAGQERLGRARAVVLGVGALGTVAAEMLVRAGVGQVRLIDRDFVEASNLQRQSLFTEADARDCLPKAVAAAQHLAAINSGVTLEPMVADLHVGNVRELIAGGDAVIDGTDNFHTRHLLNDACCAAGIPWIYGACVGAYACSMPILPGVTACLACIQDELPAAGDSPTCDSAGIISPAVHLTAAWQGAEALKILSGRTDAVRRTFWSCDLWTGQRQELVVDAWRNPACRACSAQATHPHLNASKPVSIVLCGRDGLQLRLPTSPRLEVLERNLGDQVERANAYLVRWRADGLVGTCFRDGRVIVQGTQDETRARAFCDRWLGG